MKWNMTQSVMKNLPSMLWILFNLHLCCLYPPISLGSISYPSTYLLPSSGSSKLCHALPRAAIPMSSSPVIVLHR